MPGTLRIARALPSLIGQHPAASAWVGTIRPSFAQVQGEQRADQAEAERSAREEAGPKKPTRTTISAKARASSIGRNSVEVKRRELAKPPVLNGDARHRGIVGAQGERRDEEFDVFRAGKRSETFAQALVGRHAAADREPLELGLMQGLARLGSQH